MTARNFKGNAVATTLTADITNAATSLVVTDATGYPAAPFSIAINRGLADEEKILVGAKSGTTFSTLTRGWDDTIAAGHLAPATVEHVAGATDFSEANNHIQATVAHGATGAVVGTTNTQTLTNKTLTSPTITGGTVSNTATLAVPTWVALSLLSGQGTLSAHYAPSIRRWAGNVRVELRGGMTLPIGLSTSGSVIAQVPIGYEPGATVTFSCGCNVLSDQSSQVNVDITTNGNMTLRFGTGTGLTWVSLDDIRYETA